MIERKLSNWLGLFRDQQYSGGLKYGVNSLTLPIKRWDVCVCSSVTASIGTRA